MSVRDKPSFDLREQLQERASLLFEAQLESIGLSKEQIQTQSLEELQDSLERFYTARINQVTFA